MATYIDPNTATTQAAQTQTRMSGNDRTTTGVKTAGWAAKTKDAVVAIMIGAVFFVMASLIVWGVVTAGLMKMVEPYAETQGDAWAQATGLSIPTCLVGFIVLGLVIALVVGNNQMMKANSVAAQAGSQKAIDTLTTSVDRMMDRIDERDKITREIMAQKDKAMMDFVQWSLKSISDLSMRQQLPPPSSPVQRGFGDALPSAQVGGEPQLEVSKVDGSGNWQQMTSVAVQPGRYTPARNAVLTQPEIAPEDEVVWLTVRSGTGITSAKMPKKYLVAAFQIRYDLSQDSWLLNRGGDVKEYGPVMAMLAACVDPVVALKRPGDPKGGYRYLLDEQQGDAWWNKWVVREAGNPRAQGG